jgi:hypothetical protein
MVLGRFKDAVSDLAETIRRVFRPPVSHPVAMAWSLPEPGRMAPLEASTAQPFTPCATGAVRADLLQAPGPVAVPLAWTPRVDGEPGLDRWDGGARVGVLPVFQPGGGSRLEVPPLPRRAEPRQGRIEGFSARTFRVRGGFPPPAPRRGFQPLDGFRAFAGLPIALGLPLAVAGEDLGRLPKALWMRYNLQLVRSTGENIRNLEVTGLYRIPAKGTRQVRQDPATGRLLVTLGPEAAGARLAPFLLARRRTDGAVLCCFVEDA